MTKDKFYKIVLYLKDLINGTKFEGKTYVVGGAVRDLYMDKEIKDIDIVVELPSGGIEFANWMEENGHTHGNVVTYPTYGTAMFHLKEYPEVEIECVQTRKEQYKDKNSRNPETEYGTLYEDAMRRDLSINSLFLNISTNQIVDCCGGLNDIKNHVIRVTSAPEIVYDEDGLRILRCVRIYSRFHAEDKNWYIDENTLKGMCDKVDRLSIITKERIADELNKMLMCDDPVCAMRLMVDIGAMRYVIPELCNLVGLEQNKYHSDDAWGHTLNVLNLVAKRPFYGVAELEVRMAALLHDIGKPHVKSVDDKGRVHFYGHELAGADIAEIILRRLKYSNDFINEVKFLVENHMRTKQWGDTCEHMKDKTLRKLQYQCGYVRFFELLTLIDADNKSHAIDHCLPNQVYMINKLTNRMVDDKTDMFDYKLPINGDDVMFIKGIKPGRDVKDCLEYAMKLAYNNPKITRTELLKHIKGYDILPSLK